MYIDTHCHLNDFEDVAEELSRIRAAGVKKMLAIGYDLPSSKRALELARREEDVFCAVGYQPTETHKYREGDLALIEEMAREEKAVCIGEIGMDYHYPDTNKPLQKKLFLSQIELAESLRLPISVHSRDDAEDMLATLRDMKGHLRYGGVLHCYSHSAEMVKSFADLGLYFAFGGTVTYKNAKKVVEAAKVVPADRILTETDAPYLPPVPHRGERNSPAYIPLILQKLAQVREIEEPLLAAQIEENAERLFRW